MPWTSMHWTVVALLAIIGLLLLVVIWQADRARARRARDGAQPMPTARQLRQWRRERIDLATEGRANRRHLR